MNLTNASSTRGTSTSGSSPGGQLAPSLPTLTYQPRKADHYDSLGSGLVQERWESGASMVKCTETALKVSSAAGSTLFVLPVIGQDMERVGTDSWRKEFNILTPNRKAANFDQNQGTLRSILDQVIADEQSADSGSGAMTGASNEDVSGLYRNWKDAIFTGLTAGLPEKWTVERVRWASSSPKSSVSQLAPSWRATLPRPFGDALASVLQVTPNFAIVSDDSNIVNTIGSDSPEESHKASEPKE